MVKQEYKYCRRIQRLKGLSKVFAIPYFMGNIVNNAAIKTELLKNQEIKNKNERIFNVWIDAMNMIALCFDVNYSAKKEYIKIFIKQLKGLKENNYGIL
jgi:hypothetical protein